MARAILRNLRGSADISNIEKRLGESEFDYHKRLVKGKLVDKTLADVDYVELAKLVFGKDYSSDVARRMMYGSKYTIELMEACGIKNASNIDILNAIEEEKERLLILRQQVSDDRVATRKIARDQARRLEIAEIFKEAISNVNPDTLTYEPCPTITSDNDIMVSLNDIHYGATCDNYWRKYNSDICRSMMQTYLSKIIEIGKLHNSSNCYIWENGDAISGSIHKSIQITNKEDVIEQVVGVSELIANFIAELSKHFNMVYFTSVAGNHSRLDPNKDDALIGERLDDLIGWYLEAKLQNFDNVVIGAGERIDPTMYLLNIRGKNYCGVHGDFDGSEAKVQALKSMIGKPLYAVLFGHLHHNKVGCVQGVNTIMAGSFLGMDEYCVKKRLFGKPEQLVSICDENGIRCHYPIVLE